MKEDYTLVATGLNHFIHHCQPRSRLSYPLDIPTDPTQRFHERVPVELWSIIFIHCLPSSYDFPKPWALSLHHIVKLTDPPLIPIVLASVCRTWRHVACNTPRLWEVCWLNYKNLELNDIWLNRTGTRLLSLYGQPTMSTYLQWGTDGRKEASRKFMRSILAHRKRWKFVKLDILPLTRPLPDFVLLIDDEASAFPALEYFGEFSPEGCVLDNLPAEPTPTWMTSMLSSATSLRHLKLYDATHYTFKQHKLLQLTHLEIDNIGTSDALLALDALPQLQRLSFHVSRPTEEHDYVVHDGLVQLCLTEDSGEIDEPSVLDYLVLPSLREIETKNVPSISILSFLNDSKCNLTDLKISHHGGPDDIFAVILGLEGVDQTLVNLELTKVPITPELLVALKLNNDDPRLTFLERISFTECTFDEIDEDFEGWLSDCIISRCSGFIDKSGSQRRVAQLRHVFMGTLRIPNKWDNCWYTHDLARLAPLSGLSEGADGSRFGELVIYRCDRNSKRRPKPTSIFFSLGQPEFGVYADDGLE